MGEKREKPVCRYCGSDDVVADATARWDVKGQCWEHSHAFDSGSCCECGEENKRFDWGEVGEPLFAFTVWVCQANGEGTTWFDFVEATDAANAETRALEACGSDWGGNYPPEALCVLGVARGRVDLVGWNDAAG